MEFIEVFLKAWANGTIFSFQDDYGPWFDNPDDYFWGQQEYLEKKDPSKITYPHPHLFYSYSLFFFSMIGLSFCYGNILKILIYFELGLLGVGLQFIYVSIMLSDPSGLSAAAFMLLFAGTESAIGLSLFLLFFRFRGRLDFGVAGILRG